ncbi:MAG: IS66 family insertion sequence element accessory protein TnpB [Cyclobacteriaceae bacterium]|jgi:transposase|nr:IS66 family insertion sequence element accessory protein TnpB [Cyclobacteriaceae bacterium]
MISLPISTRYFLYHGPADMRKGFDALCGLVRQVLREDPLSGAIFIFINRNRTQVKLLHWEKDGFSIYYKRLERGTFELPQSKDQQVKYELSASILRLILDGVQLKSVRQRERFSMPEKV